MNKRQAKGKAANKAALYLKTGYLNYKYIIDYRYPFTVLVGGRAIGKTYGIIDHCIKNNIKFIYMRRNQAMIDQLSTDALNPIKPVCEDQGKVCGVKKQGKYITRLLAAEGDISAGSDVGIMVALSTFANLRGFDASEFEVLIFDEFIPQENEKKQKGEGLSFLNAIETISRNRELQNKKPILTFLLTNSNSLNSDILISLNLFDNLLFMQTAEKEIVTDDSRGLRIIRPRSKISELKKKTTLYQFAGEGDFSNMAIDNQFTLPDIQIKPINIRGWRPIAVIEQLSICIYKKDRRYYIAAHISGAPKDHYIFDKKGLVRFEREQHDFIRAISENRAYFQNVKLFYLLNNYLSLV